MTGLTKVVQRRCERRECDRFLMPVDSGEVCQAPGCGQPLAIKRKLRTWVPVAAGSILLICASSVGIFLSRGAKVPDSVAPASAAERVDRRPAPRAAVPSRALPVAEQSVSRGEALARRGLYEDARAEFQRATLADPTNPVAWANLGAADAVTGRIQEARDAYEKALALDPDQWLAHYNLAILLAREGDRDGAVLHLERFFSLSRTREETRRQAIDDMRRDPSLRALMNDPRLRALAGH